MRVMAFSASPRIGGNSEILLNEVIAGLGERGANVTRYRTQELDIAPCRGCGACQKKGRCVIDDTFQIIHDQLIACDGIVFASPLYFMNIPALGKALVDRCQSFWAAREILGMELFGGRKRSALVIGCSSKHHGPGGADIFRGYSDTMNYVLQALGTTQMEPVYVCGVEEAGAVLVMPEQLERARQAGRHLADRINGTIQDNAVN